MTPDDIQKLVDLKAAELMEHVDAVQILVSWPSGDNGTHSCYRGSGNWFARAGMCHDFIERDRAGTLVEKMPKPPQEPPDTSEEWKQ